MHPIHPSIHLCISEQFCLWWSFLRIFIFCSSSSSPKDLFASSFLLIYSFVWQWCWCWPRVNKNDEYASYSGLCVHMCTACSVHRIRSNVYSRKQNAIFKRFSNVSPVIFELFCWFSVLVLQNQVLWAF